MEHWCFLWDFLHFYHVLQIVPFARSSYFAVQKNHETKVEMFSVIMHWHALSEVPMDYIPREDLSLLVGIFPVHS